MRYQKIEQEIRNQLIAEMDANEKNNDPSQEPIKYVSEAHEHYVVPGFVHAPPKPSTVIFFYPLNS